MGAYLFFWIACAAAGYFIAEGRAPKKAALGGWLGLLLGPIGVGIAFTLKD